MLEMKLVPNSTRFECTILCDECGIKTSETEVKFNNKHWHMDCLIKSADFINFIQKLPCPRCKFNIEEK